LGGAVNVVTKSGTNQLHGAAWEYLRNNALDARNTFQAAVTPYRQNQFGVSAGGPVMLPKLYDGRNKTFFFGAFEGQRFTQAANNYLHLPTDAELAGDLTGEAQAFNPFSTRPDPAKPITAALRKSNPANLIDTRLVGWKQDPGRRFKTSGSDFSASDATPYADAEPILCAYRSDPWRQGLPLVPV
jgi:hypothetical protein